MKQKLHYTLFLFCTVTMLYAGIKNNLSLPTATSVDQTICPGTGAVITMTGTPNCIVTIQQNQIIPYITDINIGPSGTVAFTTPILYQSLTFNIIRVRNALTLETNENPNASFTIHIGSNGCANLTPVVSENSLLCNAGECRTIMATTTPLHNPSSYDVTSILYCPPGFDDPANNYIYTNHSDDVWSSPINLPFNFNFFNQNYSSCQIGTNGVISFNAQTPGSICDYQINNLTIPNPQFAHKNAVFGVFQDTSTNSINNEAPSDVSISWRITGSYPCRKLIVNFFHLGQNQCNQANGLQNYQIVLYETSNVIEVFVQNRTACTSWQNGSGIIGIINADGTQAYTPASRNTGSWSATNEAWRFTPSGQEIPVSIEWFEGNNQIGTGASLTVCPTQTTTYTCHATYGTTDIPYSSNVDTTIEVTNDFTQNPADLSVCYDAGGTYHADLTQNDTTILGSQNAEDYEISYFTSQSNAQSGTNQIANPSGFTFSSNQVIYARIMSLTYGCVYVKPFQLTISNPVGAPEGISPQFLSPGQTLADVVVTGNNIQWYDAPQGGNQLPLTTVLQNNTSYYASQSVNNCESRSTQSFRLVVLVQLTLDTPDFDKNAFTFYPNPTSGILTLNSDLPGIKLDIFNVLSQKIQSQKLNSGSNIINLSNFSSGIYLFQLSLDNKVQTFKIVKN